MGALPAPQLYENTGTSVQRGDTKEPALQRCEKAELREEKRGSRGSEQQQDAGGGNGLVGTQSWEPPPSLRASNI